MNFFAFRLIGKALAIICQRNLRGVPVTIHSDVEGQGYIVREAPVGGEARTIRLSGVWDLPKDASKEQLIGFKRQVEKLRGELDAMCSEQIALIQHAEAQRDAAKRDKH